MRGTWALLAATLAFAAVVVSCGGDGDEADDATPAEASSPTTAPTAAPTQDPATLVLQGEWHTTISEDDEVTLTFRATRYYIRRGFALGSGATRTGPEQIEFYGSDLCSGSGTYEWSVEGDVLTFTQIIDDPCGGRSEVLDGQTYTRE